MSSETNRVTSRGIIVVICWLLMVVILNILSICTSAVLMIWYSDELNRLLMAR